MDNKTKDEEIIVIALGVIVSGAIIINALTLYYYAIYNGIGVGIVVVTSLLSFFSLWEATRISDDKGIGCSLVFYFVIHLFLLLFGLFFKELMTAPFHWGFG